MVFITFHRIFETRSTNVNLSFPHSIHSSLAGHELISPIRYVGSQLDNPWSYAEIARSMCAEGITCTHVDQVTDALT